MFSQKEESMLIKSLAQTVPNYKKKPEGDSICYIRYKSIGVIFAVYDTK